VDDNWQQAEAHHRAGRSELARALYAGFEDKPGYAPWAHLRLAALDLAADRLRDATRHALAAQARAYDDPALLLPRFEAAAEKCADASADLLVPAEGVLNSMLTRGGVRQLAGLPVVDALAALLAHAEALVWLSRTSGLAVSRAHGYARAPAGVSAAAAARALDALKHEGDDDA